jgi:phage shock protein PspC (stress-responsive transcriptional regulator)
MHCARTSTKRSRASQAIAEKCDKLLSPQKSVVTTDEIKKVIDEMGPVEGDGAQREKSDRHSSADSSADSDTPKRLYRIQDGEMVAGVANGLAAYFGVDVVLVRVIFVILLLVTGGGFGLAYFAMMMLIPEADTMQDKAAAYGEPFNAQELVNRAKLEYARIAARFSDSQARTTRDTSRHVQLSAKSLARHLAGRDRGHLDTRACLAHIDWRDLRLDNSGRCPYLDLDHSPFRALSCSDRSDACRP